MIRRNEDAANPRGDESILIFLYKQVEICGYI